MFKPKEMGRAVIIGPKPMMKQTVDLLHKMEVAHILDFVPLEGETEIWIGAPENSSASLNEKLVKMRSGAKLIGLEDWAAPGIEKLSIDEVEKNLDMKIRTVELNILSASEAKSRIEEQLKRIEERICELRPFGGIGIPLENCRGYDGVSVFAGRVSDIKKLEQAISKLTDEYELFSAHGEKSQIALFVANNHRETAAKLLSECGYEEMRVPDGSGIPSRLIAEQESHKLGLLEKEDNAKKSIAELRKRHAQFILASEEYLSAEVQKAEAPVRFATTEHSFIIDCWIPRAKLGEIRSALETATDMEVCLEEIHISHEDEPPVLLDNPKAVKPFEFLLDAYSTPSYYEIDPSIILSFVFPLFFGFMIGDVGYGLLMIASGIAAMRLFGKDESMKSIGWCLMVSGIFASLFGVLLFGDMFGLTFQSGAHSVEGEVVYTWSSILGMDIPIKSLIHKTEASGVTQLLVISVIAGYVHIFIGLLFGIINEWKHDKKHAFGKAALMMILTGLFIFMMNMAGGILARWLESFKGSAPWVFDKLAPALSAGLTIGGMAVPYSTLALSLAGTALLVSSIGLIGLIEVLEISGHLVSYTRLAAIGVAKGAMAMAFNTLGIGMIASGNIAIGIFGVVVLVAMQMLVFVLGSMSSGIQAIRLQYVEFFMKFYKGGGTKFKPFGYERKYTIEKSGKAD
ncbi:MAG: V-type ATP synthase subunit I [Candidatus Thermoplasmatota archaeon]|nr:V-type ATP synthase subunit I [Candidatus Thermoplasmatota archaeon]